MLILAHRGYRAKYPENTILSFKKAIECGADGVELDVRKSSDDVLLIFHDPYVKVDEDYRIILNTPYDELSKLDLGGGERIPTLLEVLENLSIWKDVIFLDVEVKLAEIVDETLHLLENYGYSVDNFMISSFVREAMMETKMKNPSVRVGFIFSENELMESDPVFFVESELKNLRIVEDSYIVLPMEALEMEDLDPAKLIEGMEKIKERYGVKFGVWNVNEGRQFNLVKGIADIVITDEVENMVKLRGN